LKFKNLFYYISVQSYKFTSNDLTDRGALGEGNFGIVCKMEHKESGTMMAVKVFKDLKSLF
jgi:hypothetical protein